jgi:hypothetical protein
VVASRWADRGAEVAGAVAIGLFNGEQFHTEHMSSGVEQETVMILNRRARSWRRGRNCRVDDDNKRQRPQRVAARVENQNSAMRGPRRQPGWWREAGMEGGGLRGRGIVDWHERRTATLTQPRFVLVQATRGHHGLENRSLMAWRTGPSWLGERGHHGLENRSIMAWRTGPPPPQSPPQA